MLIVEDDDVTALVMSEYLAACGYRTTVARNGIEAVEMFAEGRPDAVFLDVLLPRRDGFDVCFSIKSSERGRTTPVVLMSAWLRDVERGETYARGLLADGFLQKPFDLDLLVTRVHELVGPP